MIQQFYNWVYTPKRLKETYIHSISHSNQKVEATPGSLIDTWINQMCYMYTMEYYLALKRKEIVTHTIIWMNLENTVLSEFIDKRETDKQA